MLFGIGALMGVLSVCMAAPDEFFIEAPPLIDDATPAQLNVTAAGCFNGTVSGSVDNQDIASIDARAAFHCCFANSTSDAHCRPGNATASLKIVGKFLGRTTVRLSIMVGNDVQNHSEPLAVQRAPFVVNTIFNIILPVLAITSNVALGCKMDLKVVKSILLKPAAPVIGLMCQLAMMPLISFAIIKLLNIDSQLALGLFATGCAPGGGSSNVWTILLDGDVNLSLTLTFLSNILCLGTLPLWLFTLGTTVWTSNVKIPFENVLITLASLIGGVSVGLLIRYCKEPVAKFIAERVLKKLSAFFIAFVVIFGVIGNLYIFELFSNPVVLPAGLMLPWSGLVISGVLAWLLRFSCPVVRTVAIETSIQNTGVPILLLRYSVGQPEADLGTVMPVASAIFTPLPLLAVLVGRALHKRLRQQPPDKQPLPVLPQDATSVTPSQPNLGDYGAAAPSFS